MQLEAYLEEQIRKLGEEAGREGLTPEDETRIDADFVRSYFLKPLQTSFVPYPLFLKMQKVIRGIFPLWFENDLLFAGGRRVLDLLSLIGTVFRDEREYRTRLQPPVSVILPTHNRAKLLERSVKSVLEQSYPELELIVVDDASKDETEQVVRSLDDNRVRYLQNEKNLGTSASKNRGIREARFDYIAFHDDDDLWRPEKLEKQMRLLANAGEEAGFCYCEMVYHRLDGTEQLCPLRELSMVRKSGYIYPELLRRNFVGGPTLLIRKECLDRVGGFREDMIVFEDWDLALRLSAKYDAAFAGEPLYDYFEHENSLTTTGNEEYLRQVKESIRSFEEELHLEREKYGLDENNV